MSIATIVGIVLCAVWHSYLLVVMWADRCDLSTESITIATFYQHSMQTCLPWVFFP